MARDELQSDAFFLRPFLPSDAARIAGWVETAQQLRWVAPSTELPLSAEKVMGWVKPGGKAYGLASAHRSELVAYGELNPMARTPDDFWLGHLIVQPDHRGRGVGRTLVAKLLEQSFHRFGARRVMLVVFPDNQVAIECYLRCGFQVMGEERHRFVEGGTRHRLLRLEIHAQSALPAAAVSGQRMEVAAL